MIYLKLFLTFLEIGAVSFGGGYAMISLIRDKCLNFGWLSEQEIMNFIAVSESTPGPIAINMATFVGSYQGGILGSFFATLGVVLPSFIIILIIAALVRNLIKYKGVQAILKGIRPVIVGLILGTAITMGLSVIFGLSEIKEGSAIDIFALIIFAFVLCLELIYKRIRKKSLSPILLILISALLGIIFYWQ